MAAPPFHLPLLLALLLLSTATATATAAAAAHSQHLHLQHHGHGPHHHRHHHRSPCMMTATAPCVHQNRMEPESEESRQSLRVLNPFASGVGVQAPSGEEAMAEMGAAADTTRLDLRSPPNSLPGAGNPMPSSMAPQKPHAEEAGLSESEAAAPPPVVDEPYRDAASPPPPPVADEPHRDAASPAPPPPVVDEPYRDAAASPAPPPPVVDEPHRDAAISPPPRPPVVHEEYRDAAASSPPPVHDDAAGAVSSGTGDDDLGLQQIAKVLSSLGYNEMASSATLLADTAPTSAAPWPWAITVFAAPDAVFFEQASCPECSRSRRRFLLEHMALGYFPYAELAAAPAMKLPSGAVGFCLDVAAQPQRGPSSSSSSIHHANLYVNGVVVAEPELYDDGRYVVHGLHGFIPPLSHASCDAHPRPHHQVHLHQHRRRRHHHHYHLSAMGVMIREAISRLRDSGFGFVALAMSVKFAELEKLSSVTVFALDDQAIFTDGGHGYVSAVAFHVVPGHRLTGADLLRLRPGTMVVVPTLAGEDHKLVITDGAGCGSHPLIACVNGIPVKEADVAISSRVAVHSIARPFPLRRLHLTNLAASLSKVERTATKDGGRHGGATIFGSIAAAAAAVAFGLVGLAGITINQRRRERRRNQEKLLQATSLRRRAENQKLKPLDQTRCVACGKKETKWMASHCDLRFCTPCVVNGFLATHVDAYRRRAAKFFCKSATCDLIPLEAPEVDPVDGDHFFIGKDETRDTITKTFINFEDLNNRKAPGMLLLSYGKSDNTLLSVRKRSPIKP